MISRYQLINWVKEAPVEWQELSNERAAYEELNRKLKQQGLLLTGHQRLGTPTFVGLVIGGWRQSGLVTTGVQEQFAQDLKILRKGCDRGYCSIVLAFAGLDLQEEAAERALQRPMWENLTELVKDICKIMCFSTRMAQLNLNLRNISFVGCWGSQDLETSTCSWWLLAAAMMLAFGFKELWVLGSFNDRSITSEMAVHQVECDSNLLSSGNSDHALARDDALQPPHSGLSRLSRLSRLSPMNDAENLQEIIMLNQAITSADTMPGLRHELHLQSEFLKSEEEAMTAMTAMTSRNQNSANCVLDFVLFGCVCKRGLPPKWCLFINMRTM